VPAADRPSLGGRWRSRGAVAAAALTYAAWTFGPCWYRADPAAVNGSTLPSVCLDGWGGPTAVAAVLSVLGAAWIGLWAGRDAPAPARAGLVDCALAAGALVLTAGGFLFPRPGLAGASSPSWGLMVAAALAAVWTLLAARNLGPASPLP